MLPTSNKPKPGLTSKGTGVALRGVKVATVLLAIELPATVVPELQRLTQSSERLESPKILASESKIRKSLLVPLLEIKLASVIAPLATVNSRGKLATVPINTSSAKPKSGLVTVTEVGVLVASSVKPKIFPVTVNPESENV